MANTSSRQGSLPPVPEAAGDGACEEVVVASRTAPLPGEGEGRFVQMKGAERVAGWLRKCMPPSTPVNVEINTDIPFVKAEYYYSSGSYWNNWAAIDREGNVRLPIPETDRGS